MYYNVAAMAEAMGISEDEVTAKIDSVVTWDDYQALGDEYVAAIGEEGKYFTSVDTDAEQTGDGWQRLSTVMTGPVDSMIRQTFSLTPFRKC